MTRTDLYFWEPPYYSRNCYKCAYYASIILTKKMYLLCSKLCYHNLPTPQFWFILMIIEELHCTCTGTSSSCIYNYGSTMINLFCFELHVCSYTDPLSIGEVFSHILEGLSYECFSGWRLNCHTQTEGPQAASVGTGSTLHSRPVYVEQGWVTY